MSDYITTEEKIKVMQAFLRGEKIECRLGVYDDWEIMVNPLWNWADCEYRVKQKELPETGSYIWIKTTGQSQKLALVYKINDPIVEAFSDIDIDGNPIIFNFDNEKTEWSYINV